MIVNGIVCQMASNVKKTEANVPVDYSTLTVDMLESMDYWQKKKAASALGLQTADQKQETIHAALLGYIQSKSEE